MCGWVAAGIALFLLLPTAVGAQGFNEQFSSATLDPAWLVVLGIRTGATGFPPPANDFSLTANPGHLRYTLTRMTHADGYLNSYQATFSFHSCCNHDPGLELHRLFGGENWLFEAKASYFMPFANGRHFDIRIYFGDGGANTIAIEFLRIRDGPFPFGTLETAPVGILLKKKLGGTLADYYQPASILENVALAPNPAGDTYYYRLERAGSVLTAMWSYDNVTWNTAWSRDMGTQLNGLGQRAVLAGLSWFVPAGSFADYDYITVTPSVIPVVIDIKPGSLPNSINPGSRGSIPVAILTTGSFDATTVNASTVRFGATGTEAAALRWALEDVDADGRMDMILHFTTAETGIICGATSASLTGKTSGGKAIKGSDSVMTVGCK